MKKRLAGSKIPAYVEVYNSLYSDIKSGVYQENEALPGETALAEKYHVSRNTLRQALAILAEDGLITRSQGRETIVTCGHEPVVSGKQRNPLIDLCKKQVDSFHIQYNYGPPTDIARAKLALTKADLVMACDTVYQAGTETVGYSFTQIPVSFFNAMGVDITQDEAIEELATQTVFQHAAQWDLSIKLIQANEMEAPFLSVETGRSLIMMEILFLHEDCTPFARSELYFLPEHYSLKFRV